MEQDELPYLRFARDTGCHLDSAVSEAPVRLLVIAARILRIMDQHVRFSNEIQKSCIALIFPFDICGEDQAVTGVLNAINCRAVQRVAVRQHDADAYIALLRLLGFVRQDWLALTLTPQDMLIAI